jgi:hypothetical protein
VLNVRSPLLFPNPAVISLISPSFFSPQCSILRVQSSEADLDLTTPPRILAWSAEEVSCLYLHPASKRRYLPIVELLHAYGISLDKRDGEPPKNASKIGRAT